MARNIDVSALEGTVGKTVWIRSKFHDVASGTVEYVKDGRAYVQIQAFGDGPIDWPMTEPAFPNNIYLEKEDLIADNRERFHSWWQCNDLASRTYRYTNSTKNVKELVELGREYMAIREAFRKCSMCIIGTEVDLDELCGQDA